MNDIPVKGVLIPPTIILAAMMVSAAGISYFTGVDGSRVFWPYLSGWSSATLIAILVWAFVETTRMALSRHDHPIQRLLQGFGSRYRLLIIPAFIFPLFLGGYTWAKASIPFTVGYTWESFWADLDYAFLRTDGWRITHALMPDYFAAAWTYFYAIIWGFALVFVGALLALFACPRTTATFYTALMLSWFLGGFVLAYSLSAAGPVFVHLVDPELAERFAPLHSHLQALLGPDNIVIKTQRYLGAGIDNRIALKGSGVSAMPSMHIATATIFLIASWHTRWRPLALLFWTMTFFGSIYLGYHYVVDAPVAVLVAMICWGVANRIYSEPRSLAPKRLALSTF